MNRRALLTTVILAAMSACPSLAAADSGAGRHDGFYLRLTTGLGYSKSAETVKGTDYAWSGMAGLTSLGIGSAVVDNLVVNADIFGSVPEEPKVEVDGEELGKTKAEITNAGLGLGVTYYVMPANVYVGASVGPAWTSVKSGGKEYRTNTGYGVNAIAGKEWWVSDNWGLGAAAQFLYMSVPDKPEGADKSFTINTTAFGVLFSATYN